MSEDYTICVRCGHNPACGFATIDEERYCHTDSHSCYNNELRAVPNVMHKITVQPTPQERESVR